MELFNTGGDRKTSPMQLLRQGRVWLGLYDYAVKDRDVIAALPAIYCLFSALELYLKAYIVLIDTDYADTTKLRKLEHNFSKLYEQIQRLAPPKLAVLIKKQLHHYKLMGLKLDTLKYPENQNIWSIDHGLVEGKQTLKVIFDTIEAEIAEQEDAWINTVYPREIHIGFMFQTDFQGDPLTLSKDEKHKLANTCSNCLPQGVIVTQEYNFPWQREPQPPKTCLICGEWFIPDINHRPWS